MRFPSQKCLELLKAPFSEAPDTGAGGRFRANNWVDGLRGIASFIVLTGHLNIGFASHLYSPAMTENGPTLLLQYPILRLVVGGRGSVAIFFIVIGYVNCINPIKNFRAGIVSPSLLNMARSSVTRVGRLQLPTMIAGLIAFVFVQLNFFELGERIDSPFFRDNSTFPDKNSFSLSLWHLWEHLVLGWNTSQTYYDPFQWTMTHILAASFRVYLVLLVLAFVRRRYCYAITGFLYWYSFITYDYYIGMNIMVGVFLAQLQVDFGPRALNLLPRPVPTLILLLGLVIWSYPLHNPEWACWSHALQKILRDVAGVTDQDVASRLWVSIGPSILMIGITFSSNAQRILKLPLFNFLGRCSYAVFLLHHTMIRSVLVWMLYGRAGLSTPTHDFEGNPIVLEAPGQPYYFVALFIFYIIMYAVAYSWTLTVDPFCARLVARIKSHIFRDEEEFQEKTMPLTSVSTTRP